MSQLDYMSYRRLSKCGMEELAARQQSIKPSGGIRFARCVDRMEKDKARLLILDLLSLRNWQDHLHVLTMPGIYWRFERKLLGKREGNWLHVLAVPKHTRFTAVENDRAIFYGGVTKMPGIDTPKPLVKILKPPSFAEHAVQTRYGTFYFANIDDLMQEGTEVYDAAWLDYMGPMSVERLGIIARFYQTRVRRTLIVTALAARENKQASVAADAAGGYFEWLEEHLPGKIEHCVVYQDTSPMAQFAVTKEDTICQPTR